MVFQSSNMSSHPEDGARNLYVHLKPGHALQNIAPIAEWLKTEFDATPVFLNSYFIASDNLYEEDNTESFLEDFAVFIGDRFPGIELVVCPTDAYYWVSFESGGHWKLGSSPS